MTDNKVFLVSEEYAKYLEDNFDIKLKNSLTPSELSGALENWKMAKHEIILPFFRKSGDSKFEITFKEFIEDSFPDLEALLKKLEALK